MCIRIIAKDLAVTITEDIVILATITATVTATETMLTPTTILATEAARPDYDDPFKLSSEYNV